MEIEADDLLREIKEEMEKIVHSMLGGCENWEVYLSLQARAKTLMGLDESIRAHIHNRNQATGGQ